MKIYFYTVLLFLICIGCNNTNAQTYFSIDPYLGVTFSKGHYKNLIKPPDEFHQKYSPGPTSGFLLSFQEKSNFIVRAGYWFAWPGFVYELAVPNTTTKIGGAGGGGMVLLEEEKIITMLSYRVKDFQSIRISFRINLGLTFDVLTAELGGEACPCQAFGTDTLILNYTTYLSRKTNQSIVAGVTLNRYSKSGKPGINLTLNYNYGIFNFSGAVFHYKIRNTAYTTEIITKGSFIGITLGLPVFRL